MITFIFALLFRAMQPSAFANQQRILQSRFPPAHLAEDDARSSTGSVSSWINVDQTGQPDPWAADVPDEDGLELPPADLRVSRAPLDPIPEQQTPAPPPPAASTAAPVTQAARNLVDNVNEFLPLGDCGGSKNLLRDEANVELVLFSWVLITPAISPCQPISSRWALAKVNVRSWCWIIVINDCNPLFRADCYMRS